MIIDCAVESDWWASSDHFEQLTQAAIDAAIAHLDQSFSDESEVSLLFTDDAAVQQLNQQWRQIDKPTNVLSFAAQEGEGPVTPVLGDIVLARQTIEREASEQDKLRDDHLTHLIIHGFLHLLGFDHETDREADEMEHLETEILNQLGIADPYTTA
ncbi:MAG: rRNA maturation RNase YbeY [Rhizobiaceae bacterium]